jgi:hypothetical protein
MIIKFLNTQQMPNNCFVLSSSLSNIKYIYHLSGQVLLRNNGAIDELISESRVYPCVMELLKALINYGVDRNEHSILEHKTFRNNSSVDDNDLINLPAQVLVRNSEAIEKLIAKSRDDPRVMELLKAFIKYAVDRNEHAIWEDLMTVSLD